MKLAQYDRSIVHDQNLREGGGNLIIALETDSKSGINWSG